ncbi:ATP-dependent DNA ligase [Mycolicibacterium canariasense]|uniref:Probable DNA ligase n=1 Tax=Mycolicibacterium canariasense TaxID=228230 RepID=A0A100WAN8_MYCCR|nr:ATP-dependent DNA ligase [Mycolicibacterium canariasense]MCV7209447.1 ATP-dependent DNA ligase [Mycolicibacterium canariasense]ORV05750.1 ATP-dependent DNA ligase [Mycolicibacterium canariasense]GAS95017.1 ATP-dependent DNA ligase [Mycolicibacterium canariasense]
MLLSAVAEASVDVAAASSRLAKTARVADLLAHADPADVGLVVSWLAGELPQRQIGVGWAALRHLPPPADAPTLTVSGVDQAFSRIKATTGKGSQALRSQLLGDLFTAATAAEQAFLRRLLSGELRQGALAGVMSEAVAKAAGVPAAQVRRAAMLAGELPTVAVAALSDGAAGLARFALTVGRPVGPMLAQTATAVGDALEKLGGDVVFEAKLDGARVQIHRDGDRVSVYTRSLDDVTARLPEVVDAALALPVTHLIADAEAIALRPDGRPHRFQVTASRFGNKSGAREHPLSVFFFDVLHHDGTDLLDLPTTDRLAVLDAVVPAGQRVDRLITADADAAGQFLQTVLAAGHEGVMAKSSAAPYEAGRRGSGWLKVKPVHTLDLVVLAVEWGSGRRAGKLSNIHLGARDPATGGFVMLGKTFKGMTDAMLDWQTRRFTELAVGGTDGYVVAVRPEQVVEIAFDGVQGSTRYPGGMALRFARVVRYRDDKRADEADTIDTVRAHYERGDSP